MDKESILLIFLIVIAGALVFGSYMEFPLSVIMSAIWGVIVPLIAIKIDKQIISKLK